MDQKFDRQLAIHEAGHAVVGRVLGIPCGHVTIAANDRSAGHAITLEPWKTLDAWEARGKVREYRSAIFGRIMTYMAGAEAVAVIAGVQCQGDGDDRRWIDYMLDDMLPEDWPPARFATYAQRMRLRTQWVIRRHRAAVERVAEALVARRTLTADEIDTLVAGR